MAQYLPLKVLQVVLLTTLCGLALTQTPPDDCAPGAPICTSKSARSSLSPSFGPGGDPTGDGPVIGPPPNRRCGRRRQPPCPPPGPAPNPGPSPAPSGSLDSEEEAMVREFDTLQRSNPAAMELRAAPSLPSRDHNTCNNYCWYGKPYSLFLPGVGEVLVVQRPNSFRPFEQYLRFCWCDHATFSCRASSPWNSWSGSCRPEKTYVNVYVRIPRVGNRWRWFYLTTTCCCTPRGR